MGEKYWGCSLPLDFLTQQEWTINNVVRSILKQLVGRGEVAEGQREAFKKRKKEVSGRWPALANPTGMFRAVIPALPQVLTCIDTLDECLTKRLPELLKSLRDIFREPLVRECSSPGGPISEVMFKYTPPRWSQYILAPTRKTSPIMCK